MAPKKMDLLSSGDSNTCSVSEIHNKLFSPDFMLELRALLEEREGDLMIANYQSNAFSKTLSISGSVGDTTLMIRVFNGAQVIIKYVVLQKQRIGTLTEVAQRVCKRAIECAVPTLVVESVLTSEMLQWCKKYGLRPDPASGETENGLGVSYTIPTDEFLCNVLSE